MGRNDAVKSKYKKNDLSDVTLRMKNLIGLINAEKFNFEDLDAWRMGSLMDRRFRDHWKIRSNELSNFRMHCKQEIDAGNIDSLGALFELIETNKSKIISEEEITINSINEAELEDFYKRKLHQQLKDQVENHSRDIKNTLERDFKRHHHKIAKETGQFSRNVLQKKILDTIERMDQVFFDQHYNENELNDMFKRFWESEHVIGSAELQQLRNDNTKSYREQKTDIRRNIKHGFEAAFEPERYDVAVKQEFEYLGSLQNWPFSYQDLMAIKVMNDKTYFRSKPLSHYIPFNSPNYDLCMTQIYSRFTDLIDGNPYTEKNYDGDVDFTKIRDLCISFRQAIIIVTNDYKITEYVKPIFMVRCIAFASKMLWGRIISNSEQSEKKNDPVNQLNEKKPFYQKLFRMKLSGAQRSHIWQQQLQEFFKEALRQIYLNVDESYETHEVIDGSDGFIRECSRNSQSVPSLETYRRFRFHLYMAILEDTKKLSKSESWEKWKGMSDYDMRPREKQFLRSSISDLFRSRQSDLKERIRTFIASKYDIMVGKLQFADNITQKFQSVETIVNFICQNMAHGENDSYKILIPLSVKEAMKINLTVRDSQELESLLDESGLQKILRVVRSELQKSKQEFLKNVENQISLFYSPDQLDDRIIPKLWKGLESMKCNYLCPWCGMPCCNTYNCNNLYDRDAVHGKGKPSTTVAKEKHSCQFHRDSAITGTRETINDKETDRIPNNGDCPRLIQIGQEWRIKDPEKNDGSKITVPTSYFDTTWRIKSAEDDPELGSGFFWQWFLAFFQDELLKKYNKPKWACSIPNAGPLYEKSKTELQNWVKRDGSS